MSMFNGKNPSADAKAIRTGVGIGALVIVVLIIVFNCFYKVGEQEQAVVTTFGRVQGVKTAGLYFKLPFIQQVHKVDTTTRGMQIGYVENDRTPLNGYQVPEEATMITSDFNFVNIDFYLEYKVSDPQKFLYAASEPEAVLKNLAQSCIRSTVINYPVDEVITTGKGQIQAEVREMLTQELQRAGIGIELVNISVQDAEPPTETIMQAFKAVETAKQEADTAVNTALKYQNEGNSGPDRAGSRSCQGRPYRGGRRPGEPFQYDL